MDKNKPISFYDPTKGYTILGVGFPAVVFPLNHTSPFVSLTRFIRTTEVVKLKHTDIGPEFETLNTRYFPELPIPASLPAPGIALEAPDQETLALH